MAKMAWVLRYLEDEPVLMEDRRFLAENGSIDTYETRQYAMDAAELSTRFYSVYGKIWLWFPERATLTETPDGTLVTPRGINFDGATNINKKKFVIDN